VCSLFDVLDVGCGTSELAKGSVNVDFCRSDVNVQVGEQLVGEVSRVKNIPNFVVADACHLPFKDNCFTVVYSSHTIEHVAKPALMLKELLRVCNRKVVVRCPHRKGSGAKRPFHLSYLDEGWFTAAANYLGFNDVTCFVNGLQSFVDFPFKRFDKCLFAKAFRYVQTKMGLLRPFEVEVWIKKKQNLRVNDPVRFVCVFNNRKVLVNCLLQSNISLSDLSLFGNFEGCSLPTLFNSFVGRINFDCWLVFCHQDFVFNDDLKLLLAGKDAEAVYGAVGVRFGSRKVFGRFTQSDGVNLGERLCVTAPVQTVDEMCFIVHSSLFNSGLRFDERFRFHFYGADLCLQAFVSGANVFALQMECQHKSRNIHGDVESIEYKTQLQLFADKWRRFLPVKTTTLFIDRSVA
jgi:SAM-dependent methyltransferase